MSEEEKCSLMRHVTNKLNDRIQMYFRRLCRQIFKSHLKRQKLASIMVWTDVASDWGGGGEGGENVHFLLPMKTPKSMIKFIHIYANG